MTTSTGRSLFEDRLKLNTIPTLAQLLNDACSRASRHYASEAGDSNQYHDLIGSGAFLPTTVLLHHAANNQLNIGGCMVWPLPITPRDLFIHTIPSLWNLLQAGNGVGFDLTVLPPRLWKYSASDEIAPGVIETLAAIARAVDTPLQYVGLKRAAFMASLAFDHPDVFEFVTYKRTHGIPVANFSIATNDRYLEAFDRDGYIPLCWRHDSRDHYLTTAELAHAARRAAERGVCGPDLSIDSHNNVVSAAAGRIVGKTIGELILVSVRVLHQIIAETAHACGEPGLLNLAAINRTNPTLPCVDAKGTGIGVIKTTAPCGEQPLLDYESCFLGSFNLSRFVSAGRFQFGMLEAAVPIAVQFLDDLIDCSNSGIPIVDEVCKANRKIGIGVMGLADVFAELGLPYNAEPARELARDILRTIHEQALNASRKLALERGPFPNWNSSSYAQAGEPPRRHATLTTIAPTGYISQLVGCSSSIEPYYRLSFRRPNGVWTSTPLLKRLSEIGFGLDQWIAETRNRRGDFEWDGTLRSLIDDPTTDCTTNARLADLRKVFVTSVEVKPADHLSMLEAIQPYVENGISKTINLASDTTVEVVSAIFEQVLRSNLKGLTVFRERGERQGYWSVNSSESQSGPCCADQPISHP